MFRIPHSHNNELVFSVFLQVVSQVTSIGVESLLGDDSFVKLSDSSEEEPLVFGMLVSSVMFLWSVISEFSKLDRPGTTEPVSLCQLA